MATNITGVVMTQPTVDPDIAAGGNFPMGGQITVAGGGGWAESGDMYFEWDQGVSSWATIGGSGDLYTEDTNPITGLQTTEEQVITVKSDDTPGSFQVRVKLIEDDLTEYTTTPVDVTVTGAGTFYQNTGQASMAIAGILNKKGHKDAGNYALAIAGNLGTIATFPVSVGGHAMAIAGTLISIVTHICNVGAYAMTITGSLLRQTSKTLGEYVMTITGTLNKQGYKDVGGYAMTITGVLATATIFLQAVGGAAMSIIGSLIKQTSKVLGGYAMIITGSLIKKTSKTIGGYAMSIVGTLTSATTYLQSVGQAAMTIAGSLVKKITIFIGNGVISPSVGNLTRKTSIFMGKASMSITGVLSTIATFLQSSGGGSISPTGILSKIVTYVLDVGGYTVNIAGALSKIYTAGNGAIQKSKIIFGNKIGYWINKGIGLKNKWIG